MVPHQLLESDLLLSLGGLSPEVETAQPRQALGVTPRDLVEHFLQPGGELVVDEVLEVALQQLHHGKGQEGRHQGRALLEHVPTVEDGADDRGVGGGTADLPILQFLDQGRLGVARGRAGVVPLGLQVLGLERIAFHHLGQATFTVVQVGGRVIGTLDVGLQEAVEGDDLAGRAELDGLARAGGALDPDGDGLADGVLHLGGDGALPDEFVQTELRARQPGLCGCAELVPRRADRLVRLLGVLHLLGVHPRLVGQVVGTVQTTGLGTGGLDRVLRQRGAVGTHVGDVTVLVQPLSDLHGLLRRQAQLA